MKKISTLLFFCMLAAIAGAQSVTFTTETLATTGANRAVVDMNGDYLDDIVSITQTNVNIFYQQPNGDLVEENITTTNADFTPSWSLAAADYDRNGFTDLVYGGQDGVTIMRANSDGTGFQEISGSEYVFSQRSNFIDINNDGDLDLFVCHDVEPNVYYINDGDNNLEFIQGGLGDFPTGGNYGSVWIDYDNDRDMDMFIAKCGGSVERRTNQMFRNNGDGTFTEVGAETGLADPMQTWSSAWGDYDNDGDMDVFVGASSGVHKFMTNNGDGTFTDTTAESGVLALTTTGIENTPVDFNNDGFLDIASNGNILIGNGNNTFSEILENVISFDNGSVGDINNDGYMDLFANGTIYYNDGGTNNWITINTVGTESNINGIGARVEIETPSGTQIRDVRSGEGFRFMSTLNTHFGIGTDTEINSITVYWPSGVIDVIDDANINEVITIIESPVLGVNDNSLGNLIVYPNPTQETLSLKNTSSLDNAIYTVFDVTGKRVLNAKLTADTIDVSTLESGAYVLRIFSEGTFLTQKFIKK